MIKTYTRKELRDMMDKHDAAVSKRGQAEATRYLRSREKPPTRGNIRAGIAFVVLSIATLVIALAL
jgi:hypothetical protein